MYIGFMIVKRTGECLVEMILDNASNVFSCGF